MKLPEILYHATYNRFLGSIMQVGLLPGGKGWKNWDCDKAVYLASDPEFCISMVECSDNECDDEIVVLEIDVSLLDSKLLKEDNNIDWSDDDVQHTESFMYLGTVPVSSLWRVS